MGWNKNNVYNVIKVTDDVYDLAYELKNCVRGAYTGCKTYEELQEYVHRLARKLDDAAELIDVVVDEYDEYDEDE